MVVRLAPSETGGRGQGLGFTAPAQPKSSERTSQEDLIEPSEQVSRSDGTIGGGEAPKKCDPRVGTTVWLQVAVWLRAEISKPAQLIFAPEGRELAKDMVQSPSAELGSSLRSQSSARKVAFHRDVVEPRDHLLVRVSVRVRGKGRGLG